MIRTTALLTLLALPLAASAAAPPQETEVSATDEGAARVQAVVGRLLEAQGGIERFEALRGFRLEFVDVDVQPPTIEGEPPVEVPSQPVQMDVLTDPEDRRFRFTESVDLGNGEQQLVRVAAADGVRVMIDGEPRKSEQLGNEARFRAVEMLLVFDLLWGALNGQVLASDAGQRTRDGQLYDCLELRFPEGRGVLDVFVVYVDPQTGLIRRADHYSGQTRLRQATLLFEGYTEVAGIRLPGRVEFHDRDFALERYWSLTGLAIDPDWPEGHFDLE